MFNDLQINNNAKDYAEFLFNIKSYTSSSNYISVIIGLDSRSLRLTRPVQYCHTNLHCGTAASLDTPGYSFIPRLIVISGINGAVQVLFALLVLDSISS